MDTPARGASACAPFARARLLQANARQHRRSWRIAPPAGGDREPAYVQALIRTVVAFERAIALRRPLPYDGDVFMLNPAFASALAASIAGIRAVARDTRRAAAETG